MRYNRSTGAVIKPKKNQQQIFKMSATEQNLFQAVDDLFAGKKNATMSKVVPFGNGTKTTKITKSGPGKETVYYCMDGTTTTTSSARFTVTQTTRIPANGRMTGMLRGVAVWWNSEDEEEVTENRMIEGVEEDADAYEEEE